MITGIDKNTALVLIDLQKALPKGDTAHPVKGVLAKLQHYYWRDFARQNFTGSDRECKPVETPGQKQE